MSKKIAVFFPGIGYNVDKPLMYYSRKLAAQAGCTEICISYQNMPGKIMGDPVMLKKAISIGFDQAVEQLSDTDFSQYDEILFFGKSIGTAVAVRYAANLSTDQTKRTRLILYTPVEATFESDVKNAIAFIGDADPWSDLSSVKTMANRCNVPLHIYPGCNHSLEAGSAVKDIETLSEVIEMTSKFITK